MDPIFLKKEEVITIDLHDMILDEARYYLEKTVEEAPEYIKEIEVIHGYHKGKKILEMVRKEFKHKRVKRKYVTFNNGITRLVLKE